jgi:hypothetical protein
MPLAMTEARDPPLCSARGLYAVITNTTQKAVFCAGGSLPSTSLVCPDALERSWRMAAVGRV